MFPRTLYSCSRAKRSSSSSLKNGWYGENKWRVRRGKESCFSAWSPRRHGNSKRDYDGQFSVWHCLPRLRDEYHLGERGPEHWLQKPLKRPWFQPIASTAKNIRGLEEGVARENHSHLMPLVHLRSVPLQHLGRVALVRLGRRNSSKSLLANRARAYKTSHSLEPSFLFNVDVVPLTFPKNSARLNQFPTNFSQKTLNTTYVGADSWYHYK